MPLSQELLETLAQVGVAAPAREFESEELDFKQTSSNVKKTLEVLADAAVCFTNGRGGTIVLGVDDKAGSRAGALVGAPEQYTVDVVRKAIFDRTRPSMTVVAREHTEDGVRLLIIEVPEGVAPHSNTGGTATRRLGTECLPFTPEQQREVLRARGQIDWSADASGVAPEDCSVVELQRMRRLLGEAGRDELAALADPPLLEALRLVTQSGELTNAGVLLLGDEGVLSEHMPTHGYSYQYRPSPGSEATSRFRGSRPLMAAIDALLDAVETRAEVRPLNLVGGVQVALSDYPARAVREVVVNALIHRAYDVPGTVDIEQSAERLMVVSPGGLVAGVTPHNILTHPSTPRHRLLAETVSVLQLAERTGQGIDRAYREMLQAGKAPPSIEDAGLRVTASLDGGIGNDAFARFLRDVPGSLSGDVEVLIALSLLRTAPSIDAFALAGSIQRNPAQAEDVLRRLADESAGLLEATRRTLRKPYPTYRLRNEPLAALARAVTYRRRTLDQTDAKIVEHVREYGFVTNKTLQRLFDRDVYAARNMLTDLRERDILEKLGSARGGPGVRYGPGKKFPRRPRRQTDRSRSEDAPSVSDQLPLPDTHSEG